MNKPTFCHNVLDLDVGLRLCVPYFIVKMTARSIRRVYNGFFQIEGRKAFFYYFN